ncbi:MAG: hypothetical protein KDA74_03130 [Planctomycetaceae bacterium]|nr:hypothetical protein [Planctomycetaceae bacterium]
MLFKTLFMCLLCLLAGCGRAVSDQPFQGELQRQILAQIRRDQPDISQDEAWALMEKDFLPFMEVVKSQYRWSEFLPESEREPFDIAALPQDDFRVQFLTALHDKERIDEHVAEFVKFVSSTDRLPDWIANLLENDAYKKEPLLTRQVMLQVLVFTFMSKHA